MNVPPAARDLSLAQQVALLSGGDFWRTRALPEAGVGACVLSDGPHGLRFQPASGDNLGTAGSEPSTCFPTAVTMASTWDEALVAEVAGAVAVEALALGVDVVLGPGLNIKRHPLCGRNFEYFSEDPLLSGRLAAASVRGLQDRGVGACLKHFAVNNQEGHRFLVDAVVDERTLREIYLAGFEHAVRTSRPWTVMAAYNQVNGAYATENRRLLADLLRGEWGFDGLVMSDWAATADRVAAVAAGMDLEMPSSHGLSDGEVLAAVGAGRLPAALVTASAQRVLDLVARSAKSGPRPTIPVDEHDALARRAAAQGTVLLTNDGLLPLTPGASVAVIGAFADQPRYQGAGSSLVNPLRVSTALDEFRRRGAEVSYAAGYDPKRSDRDDALIAAAVEAAAGAEVAVVLVGLPGADEGEGYDRTHLDLPAQHNALVAAVAAANPRTVVALSNGAPVLLPWKDAPAAILESYLGGQAAGAALVDVLYGDVEPGGRLAETFPAALADVAADPYFPGDPHQVEYREGLFVGYRHHTTAGLEPLFAFGHGLGYTTFRWDAVAVDRTTVDAGDAVTVSLTVTNVGERAGSDVVQVYLSDHSGVVLRPRRELAGFAKVRLAAGASETVTIELPARAFAFYDVEAADWRIPAGAFTVEVARSSVDIVETLTVQVKGGVDRAPEGPDTPPIAATGDQFATRLGRPVPRPRPVRPFTRQSSLGELRLTRTGRLLNAVLWRIAPFDEETKADEIAMRTYKRALDELPLRGAAIYSEGKLPWSTVDILLDVMNGRPGRAVTALGRKVTARVGRLSGRSARRPS
jgi:beta-glucosidase